MHWCMRCRRSNPRLREKQHRLVGSSVQVPVPMVFKEWWIA
jgi:hypothetical protein